MDLLRQKRWVHWASFDWGQQNLIICSFIPSLIRNNPLLCAYARLLQRGAQTDHFITRRDKKSLRTKNNIAINKVPLRDRSLNCAVNSLRVSAFLSDLRTCEGLSDKLVFSAHGRVSRYHFAPSSHTHFPKLFMPSTPSILLHPPSSSSPLSTKQVEAPQSLGVESHWGENKLLANSRLLLPVAALTRNRIKPPAVCIPPT